MDFIGGNKYFSIQKLKKSKNDAKDNYMDVSCFHVAHA
jgi:hypothetical protein